MVLKYFREGGLLYGSVYTILRGLVWFRCLVSTLFYRRVLARCGRGTVFRTGVYVMYPRSIEVGEYSVIGDDVALLCDVPGGRLRIGSHTKIWTRAMVDFSGGLLIGNNVTISSGVTIRTHDHSYVPSAKARTRSLVIGDNVWVGSGASILPRVGSIGSDAVIGAGAVVTKAVPEGAVVAGNPARIIRYVREAQSDCEHSEA